MSDLPELFAIYRGGRKRLITDKEIIERQRKLRAEIPKIARAAAERMVERPKVQRRA